MERIVVTSSILCNYRDVGKATNSVCCWLLYILSLKKAQKLHILSNNSNCNMVFIVFQCSSAYIQQTQHWFLQGSLLAKVASIKLSNQIWMFSAANSKRASRMKFSLISWQTTELIVSSPYRNWISIVFRRPLGTMLDPLIRTYNSDRLAAGSSFPFLTG